MKKFSILVFIFAAICIGCVTPFAENPARVVVMSYNIHHGEGVDGVFDLVRIAKVILSVTPDLVALQEVDRKTGRSSGVDQAAELGRLTGMNFAFGKAMDYDGGQYGEAVLSRFPISKSITHPLPYTEGHEPRAVLEVKVKLENGAAISFWGTHLDHVRNSPDRLAAVQEMARLIHNRSPQPTILAGDLNAVPESKEINILREIWAIAGEGLNLFTIPVRNPSRQIDYICFFPKNRWEMKKIRVLDEQVASDHRPIMAVLQLIEQ